MVAHRAPSGRRQRARWPFAWLSALAGLLCLLASVPGRADVPIGLAVGYAFRPTNALVDDRAHGAAAAVVVDAPPVWWGFSGRAEGLVLAWPAKATATSPLLVTGGAASLTWQFDDTAVRALASLGAYGGVLVDGDVVTPTFGPLVGLTLRFPVADGVFVDARLSVPLGGDGTAPVAGAALIGVSIAPDAMWQSAREGRSPTEIARDAGAGLSSPGEPPPRP